MAEETESKKKQKSSKSRRETAVQGTNDNSIVSKCATAAVGYVKDDFLHHFVAKVTRRAPLIHRGYYIRAKVVSYLVRSFLQSNQGTPKQVLSLGAGFDSTYFTLKCEGLLTDVVYCEVDFPEVVKRKKVLINSNPVLLKMFGEEQVTTTTSNPLIEVNAVDYKLLGVDLTRLTTLEAVLRLCGLNFSIPTLVLSEVVLAYLSQRCSTAVVGWAAETFPNASLVLYEQMNPDDSFGIFMRNHFTSLGSPLKSIQSFPSLQAQTDRCLNMGWSQCRALDMNHFYYAHVSPEEHERIEQLEPFDEYEEWHLKCSHYFVLCAVNGMCDSLLSAMNTPHVLAAVSKVIVGSDCVQVETAEGSSAVNIKRFAHATASIDDRLILTVGGFGEQEGKHQRLTHVALTDLITMTTTMVQPDVEMATMEVCRLHPTICATGNGTFLVFGGRLSPQKPCTQILQMKVCQDCVQQCIGDESGLPDTSAVECGVVKDNSGTVVDSAADRTFTVEFTCSQQKGHVPCGRWRHSALFHHVSGKGGVVVVYGGRTQQNLALDDCYMLRVDTGQWEQVYSSGESPGGRQSHTASLWCNCMIVTGGMDRNLVPLNSVCILNLETMVWTRLDCHILPRYSHTAHVQDDFLVLVGGVNLEQSPPGIAIIHIPTGKAREFPLPKPNKDSLVMLHRHTSVKQGDGRIVIIGGGGNCFSFGTHLNVSPLTMNLSNAIKEMQLYISADYK